MTQKNTFYLLVCLIAPLLSISACAQSIGDGDYFGRTTKPVLQGQISTTREKARAVEHVKQTMNSSNFQTRSNPTNLYSQSSTSRLIYPKDLVITADTTAEQWFEALDKVVASRKPSVKEAFVLSRPFNQEKERVCEWISTAAKVAKSYRETAFILKSMPLSNALKKDAIKADVVEYRNMLADWHNDAAEIFEDYIRPRDAVQTMEELESALGELRERVRTLGRLKASLHTMDSNLRRQLKVHPSRQNDAIWQFASRK